MDKRFATPELPGISFLGYDLSRGGGGSLARVAAANATAHGRGTPPQHPQRVGSTSRCRKKGARRAPDVCAVGGKAAEELSRRGGGQRQRAAARHPTVPREVLLPSQLPHAHLWHAAHPFSTKGETQITYACRRLQA